QPQLQTLVSDFGGAEKTDWDAISKEIGLSAYRCQKTHHEMIVAKSSEKQWTPDEFEMKAL
ncbi:hypothetical protein GGI23_003800, partial [Coemansia sp. RSA 2559]